MSARREAVARRMADAMLLERITVENGYEPGLPEVVGLRVVCACRRCATRLDGDGDAVEGCGMRHASSPGPEYKAARIAFEAELREMGWTLSQWEPRWICRVCARDCDILGHSGVLGGAPGHSEILVGGGG